MKNNKARIVAYMGLMLALILTLSFVERMIPPLPMMLPGVNMGLSNIVTMYCAFFLGSRLALGLSVLKSVFVIITRGLVAGFLSLSGGLLSLLVIIILLKLFKHKISYFSASICGALTHNLGQLLAASLLLSTGVFYYLPLLIVSGIIMGSLTGITLTVSLPALHKIFGSDWPLTRK